MPRIIAEGIDFLTNNGGGNSNMKELTQKEYDNLSDEEKKNGTVYYITDSVSTPNKASNIEYDNSNSGLTSTNVQAVIDELNVNKSDITHTHDDRYYTESEIDTKLNSKSDSTHTHDVATESKSGFMSSSDKTKLNDIVNIIYPVGSVYISVNNVSPATLFGGTWEQIKDRFLLSAGNTYKNGATGGEATHKLTTNELPHLTGMITTHGGENGSIFNNASGIFKSTSTISSYKSQNGLSGGSNAKSIPSIQADFGGDTAHNNMPPYLAVYVWKRTA